MEFYDTVTEQNAREWYDMLPPHLRKVVDTQVAEYTVADAREDQKLDPNMVSLTDNDTGYSLPHYVVINRGPEGNMPEEIERFERRHTWCKRYNELTFLTVVVKAAVKIQKERKMLAQALGLKQGGSGLPSQAEGLEDTQAATIRWLQSSGKTPLEYLTDIYRDDENDFKVSDKITAARALLDYVHRKVPQKQEIETKNTQAKLDPSTFRNLTIKEIDLLESLIKKMDKQ